MDNQKQRRKFWGGMLVLALGAITLFFAAAVNGPDVQLRLDRTVPSKHQAEKLGPLLSETESWPQWFHHLVKVQVLGAEGSSPKLASGSRLRLLFDSHKSPWSEFELSAEVVELVPNRKLRLRILSDSTDRLTRLFSNIEWQVEFEPSEKGTLLRGTATAQATHWRSRLTGTIAERIVMHQVFYPDLIKLGEWTPKIAENHAAGF